MEISSFRSLPDFGMEDPLFMFQQWPVDDILSAFSGDLYHHHSSYTPQLEYNRPLKKPRNSSWEPADVVKSSKKLGCESAIGNQKYVNVMKACQGASTRQFAQAQDHILAERKRREKLSQMFITLSTLVPGLKKMDKASVLGDAIKHMKQLEEKVKILEEQKKKKSMESPVVFMNRYQVPTASKSESSSLPEIVARFCDNDVLISIHCEKRKGVLEKSLVEIEKLKLSVVNTSLITFGHSSLNITIIAQKDGDFNLNMKDVVKNLGDALKQLM